VAVEFVAARTASEGLPEIRLKNGRPVANYDGHCLAAAELSKTGQSLNFTNATPKTPRINNATNTPDMNFMNFFMRPP
jgi:hypothetical protein